MLWHSFGTMAALLQEIINIYPAINPPVADKLMLILSMINCLMYITSFNPAGSDSPPKQQGVQRPCSPAVCRLSPWHQVRSHLVTTSWSTAGLHNWPTSDDSTCRSAFLLAHIPLYLYPFLHTVSKTRSPQSLLVFVLLRVTKGFSCTSSYRLCLRLVSYD